MKKINYYFLIFILLIFQGKLHSQIESPNTLSIKSGHVFMTSGDIRGLTMGFDYERRLHKYIEVEIGMEHSMASSGSGIINADDSTRVYTLAFNSQAGNPSNFPTSFLSRGTYPALQVLNEQPYKATYTSWYLGVKSAPLQLGKHELSMGLKAGISLIDRTFIVSTITGSFSSGFANYPNLWVMVPYYERILDLYLAPDLSYEFAFTDRFSMGITGTVDLWLINGDRNQKLELFAAVRF